MWLFSFNTVLPSDINVCLDTSTVIPSMSRSVLNLAYFLNDVGSDGMKFHDKFLSCRNDWYLKLAFPFIIFLFKPFFLLLLFLSAFDFTTLNFSSCFIFRAKALSASFSL